jgi:predicted nucleotidyltransferase
MQLQTNIELRVQKCWKSKVYPPIEENGLEEKLVKTCEENDIVFLAIFGSFVRGEQKR